MAGLKAIKTKIRSIEKTKKVTRAMEAVSAAKMRKAQQRALVGRAYARAAVSVLARLTHSRTVAGNVLSAARPAQRALYIVITSDKGLAGALNSAVLRATQQSIVDSGIDKKQISIIAVGRKANDFFTARGFTVDTYHPHTDAISTELIDSLVQEAAHRFAYGSVDTVKIAYQQFASTFEQRPTLRTIFPLSVLDLEAVVRDIVPERGAYAHQGVEQEPADYTVEPSAEEVLTILLPKLASIFVYHALLESEASEHSARMVSMKSATDKAGEMGQRLTLQFNKARQAAITREVSEITGGMEAMSTN